MAQVSNRLTNNIKYYTLGVVSTKLLSFIFVPLYSLYLLPEALGTYQYIFSIISLCIPILYQDIWEGMFRFSILSKGHEIDVINTTSKYFLNLSLLYVVLFGIAAYIFKLDYAGWILLTGLSNSAVSYWQFAARALQENKAYTLSTILCSVLVLLFNVVFIVILKWQIESLFISSIAGGIGAIAILEVRLHLISKAIHSTIDKPLLINIIKYSIPLAINVISWWLTSSCNNIIVTKMLGPEANGILSMALRFGSIFVLLTSIITMAWQEESFHSADDENKDAYFNKILNLYTKALFSSVIVLIPVTYICYKYLIFGEYKTGVALTSFMYINGAFNAIICHLGSEFLTRGESKVMFWTTLVSGIVSVLIALLFVTPLGLIGVLCGTLTGYLVNLVVRVIMLNHRMNLQMNYIELSILFAASVGVASLTHVFTDNIFALILIFVVGISFAFLYNKTLCMSLIQKYIKK